MPILREFLLAVPMLVVSLLVSAAVFGPGEQNVPSTAASRDWIGADGPSAARWLAKESFATGGPQVALEPPSGALRPGRDITPRARIRSVFAQFVPGESGRAI